MTSGRVRTWLARHENLFTLCWHLHLARNERSVTCPNCGRTCPWCLASDNRERRERGSR